MRKLTMREQVWDSLKNPEYRKEFGADVGTGLAFQIRAMRCQRGLTQEQLAELLGVKRQLITKWENPDLPPPSLKQLLKMAKIFDVGLLVRLASFSSVVNDLANVTTDVIALPSFGEEEARVEERNTRLFTETGLLSNPYYRMAFS